jgi:hypothetical protein
MRWRAVGVSVFLSLAACGSGDGASTPTTAITVTGKVLTYQGEAGAFLPVTVNGQKTSTDAGGNFSVPGVSTPYDLVVLQATRSQAFIFQGLSRADPIVLVSGSGTYARASNVNWTFSNAFTGPPGAGESYDGSLGCVSSDGQVSCGSTGSVGITPYADTLRWSGPQAITVGFYALQTFKNSSNVVTAFQRFGRSENRQLVDAQPTSVGIAYQTVTSKTLGGTVTAPPGATLTGRALGMSVGSARLYPFSYESNANGISPTFSWASPAIAGTGLYLTGTATKGAVSIYGTLTGVAPDDPALTLALPAPAEASQPANNALGVTHQTAFSWTPFAGGVYVVGVSPAASGPLAFSITTTRTEITLPDLTDLGYPLAKGAVYRWSVGALGPLHIDDFVGGVASPSYSQSSFGGERTFTTAP